MKTNPQEEHQSDRRLYNVFFNTHTVSGIVISIGLYVIFLAGAFALFQNNINNWEINAPEKNISANLDYDRILANVEKEGYDMYGRDFFVNIRPNNGTDLFVFANPPANRISADSLSHWSSEDSLAYAEATERLDFIIDPVTYELSKPDTENGGQQRIGRTLTRLHYFQQIPMAGIYLSGFVSLFFLFAVVTGVIVHWKKIVSNFFTFRIKSSIKNLWTDAHTALGVLGIPFQFMYAVTGTVFGLAVVLYPLVMLVFDDFNEATNILLPERKPYELLGAADEQVAITPLVDQAFADLPMEDVENWQVMLKSYGDENAHLVVSAYIDTNEDFAGKALSTYKLTDGTLVDQKAFNESSFATSSVEYFIQLHFGNFGGLFVQIIYFILAVLTCFVIVSGVMIWLVAREKKIYASKERFNQNVGAIYLGSCLGLYPAIALLFLAAKILPLDAANRFAILNWVFFGSWLVYTIYAYFIKSNFKINKHALLLAGAMGIAIPIVNGMVTGLWFWKSTAMGYPDSFLVDVGWLIMGALTLGAAFLSKPTHKTKTFAKKAEPALAQPEVSMVEEIQEPILAAQAKGLTS